MRYTNVAQVQSPSMGNFVYNNMYIGSFVLIVTGLILLGFGFGTGNKAHAQVNGCPNLSSAQGQAVQTISLTNAGTYSVWARVKSQDNQPQFKFSIDGVGGKLCDQTVNANLGNTNWGWVKAPGTLTWSGGSGRLQVSGTKSNVGLDCVVVTRNSSFSPSSAADCREEPSAQPISITSPLNFQTVSGTVTLTAEPSAAVSVARVRFFVNGVAVGPADTTAPYTATWNSATVSNSTHNITARVVTTTGETFTSSSVSVIVNNSVSDTTSPSATLTTPNRRILSNPNAKVTATATDNVAVQRVELRRVSDNLVLGTDTTAPYEFPAPFAIENGDYRVKAVAYDNSGNQGSSSEITIRLRFADLDRSGVVDIADLTQLISKWRTNSVPEDLNGNGTVDTPDLAIMLGQWGSSMGSLEGFLMDVSSEELTEDAQ